MYTEKTFSIPALSGISAKTIEEHLKLYSGYVKNANSVLEKITLYQNDESKTYELGELYRHFAFEFNGMRNHECYFALLEKGATTLSETSSLASEIHAQWQSFDAYLKDHATLALTRGIGWAMLSYDLHSKKLLLHWVDEQHLGQLQGTTPIIALDMWEHSYVADYHPSGKKQYIADFFANINWTVAEANFAAVQKNS